MFWENAGISKSSQSQKDERRHCDQDARCENNRVTSIGGHQAEHQTAHDRKVDVGDGQHLPMRTGDPAKLLPIIRDIAQVKHCFLSCAYEGARTLIVRLLRWWICFLFSEESPVAVVLLCLIVLHPVNADLVCRGRPQGAECSAFYANLYLFIYDVFEL